MFSQYTLTPIVPMTPNGTNDEPLYTETPATTEIYNLSPKRPIVIKTYAKCGHLGKSPKHPCGVWECYLQHGEDAEDVEDAE